MSWYYDNKGELHLVNEETREYACGKPVIWHKLFVEEHHGKYVESGTLSYCENCTPIEILTGR